MMDDMTDLRPIRLFNNYTVDIISIGDKGDGVAHVDKFVVFVPYAQLYHTYNVRIRKIFPRFAIAEIIEEVQQNNTLGV